MRKLRASSASASPTPLHRLLGEWGAKGTLRRLYTQKIDGLETQVDRLRVRDPSSADSLDPEDFNTVQLHGSLAWAYCTHGNDHHVCKAGEEIFWEVLSRHVQYARRGNKIVQ